jgi:hypothetical protein
MNKPNILYRLLIWINVDFSLLFVLLGATGGITVVMLVVMPLGSVYFERNYAENMDSKKTNTVRTALFLLNSVVFLVAGYNILRIILIFSMLS